MVWYFGFPAHYKLGIEASSATPLAPFPQRFFLVQKSLCLDGSCCTVHCCCFPALPVSNTSAGQAPDCFSCITGQDTQWQSIFWKAKSVLVIDTWPTLKNAPWYHTLLLLCVVSIDSHSFFKFSSSFINQHKVLFPLGTLGIFQNVFFCCFCRSLIFWYGVYRGSHSPVQHVRWRTLMWPHHSVTAAWSSLNI